MDATNAGGTNRIVIPNYFYDSLNDAPFTNCLVCNRALLMTPTTYVIEKAFRKNQVNGKPEPIFEYAICWDCVVNFYEKYSTKSKKNLSDYFDDNIDFAVREEMMKDPEIQTDISVFLRNCAIKGTPVELLDDYQVVGYFQGKMMVTNSPPLLFSGAVSDEILSVLSEQTLDELDDFTGKYLTGPPEFSNFLRCPKRKPVFLL